MQKIYALAVFLAFVTTAQAQWVKTNGLPGGSNTYFFRYGDTVLVKAGSLLYFSSNDGLSWSQVQPSIPSEFGLLATQGKDILVYRFPQLPQSPNVFRTDDFFQTMHPVLIADSVSTTGSFFFKG